MEEAFALAVAGVLLVMAAMASLAPIYLWRVYWRTRGTPGLWLPRALAITFTGTAIPAALTSTLSAIRTVHGRQLYPDWFLGLLTLSYLLASAALVYLFVAFVRHSKD